MGRRFASRTARTLTLVALVFVFLASALFVPAPAQSAQFQKIWGGRYSDVGKAVALDASGNIYVTGFTNSFGVGGADVLLLKYNNSGGLLFAETWGTTGWDIGRSVGIDASGNAYVAGETGNNGFLIKFGPSGSIIWAREWSNATVGGLSVDGSGGVIITGLLGDARAHYFRNGTIIRFDGTGGLLWNKVGPTANFGEVSIGHDVAVDSTGNVYALGSNVVVKLNSTGDPVWSRLILNADLTTQSQSQSRVTTDSSGNVYILLPRYECWDDSVGIRLLKLNSSGDLLWSIRLDESTQLHDIYNHGWDLAVDPSGNVYVAASLTFRTPRTCQWPWSESYPRLLKFNATGALLGDRVWNQSGGALGVAIDSSGSPIITGSVGRPPPILVGSLNTTAVSYDGTSPVEVELRSSNITLSTPNYSSTHPSGSESYAYGGLFLSRYDPSLPYDPTVQIPVTSNVVALLGTSIVMITRLALRRRSRSTLRNDSIKSTSRTI